MGKLSSKKFLMSAWLPLLHPDRWVFIWGGGNEVKAKNITSFLEDGGKVSSGQLTFDHSHRLMWAWARQDEERRRKRRHKGGGRRPLSFLLLFSLARPRPFLSLSIRKMKKWDDCEWVAGYPGNNNEGTAWQIQFAMALSDSLEVHVCELVCVLHIMASCG